MAKKSRARLARDRVKPEVVNVSEDQTWSELSKLRPALSYPELREWVSGMSERERHDTLQGIAKKIVAERR